MRQESLQFFRDLLDAPGPSGDERAAARVWRAYAESFADVRADALGSSFAESQPSGSPSVAVFGHIDEIGLVINHVDDEGYAWFGRVGGWDPEVLVGQRVRIMSRDGYVAGAIGKKARHLQDDDERSKPSKLDQLWIDIGAADAADARARIRVGDMAVLEQPIVELPGGRLVSCGAFVAAEAVRLYASDPGAAQLTGVATVSEETSFLGAHTTGHALAPAAAIAVDVTHTTDHPTTSKQKGGDVKLGGGPSLSRGGSIHPVLFDLAVDVAEAEGIAYQVEPGAGSTGTDADAVAPSGSGVPSIVISIPLRYMHSPNELVDLGDLEQTAKLVAAVARRITEAPQAL
jgi:putative aminopeptidase FrvX